MKTVVFQNAAVKADWPDHAYRLSYAGWRWKNIAKIISRYIQVSDLPDIFIFQLNDENPLQDFQKSFAINFKKVQNNDVMPATIERIFVELNSWKEFIDGLADALKDNIELDKTKIGIQ